VKLAVRRLHPDARLPVRAHEGDAGLDLHAVEGFRLEPGQRASIPTGIAVEIPPGHAGLVLPRSGLAARHGIALVNAPGLIDAGYRGEIKVLLVNTDRDAAFEAAVGDRIAQLVIVRVEALDAVETESLADSERGEGGFGSSGTAAGPGAAAPGP
jgi:dUTP diphosphatase